MSCNASTIDFKCTNTHAHRRSSHQHRSVTVSYVSPRNLAVGILASEQYTEPMWLPDGCKLADGGRPSLKRAVCLEDACSCPSDKNSLQGCCLVPGNKSRITFYCSLTKSKLSQDIVVSCDCVPCQEREVGLKGSVISSSNSLPIPLASFMVQDKVVGITDMDGRFEFSFKTKRRSLKVVIVEPGHKQGEIEVAPGHQQVQIVLEKLQNRIHCSAMEKSFTAVLASWGGTSVTLDISELAFTQGDSQELYRGPGSILHAVYQTARPPNFYTKALNNMVYIDTKGVSFGIESVLMGSLDIISDQGFKLSIHPGSHVTIVVNITSNEEPSVNELSKLHLYTCNTALGILQCWRDLGPIKVFSVDGRVAVLVAFLRFSSDFWAIGLPVRSDCFVKVIGVETGTRIRIPGLQVIMEQNNVFEGYPTFSRQTEMTLANGTCIRTGCSGGGTITAQSAETTNVSIDHGVTWSSNAAQIKFYISEFYNSKTNTFSPYYRNRGECERAPFSQETAFLFILEPPPHAQEEILLQDATAKDQPQTPNKRYCYVKVAIDDCLPLTDVQTFSISRDGTGVIHTSVAKNHQNAMNTDNCYSDVVTSLQSACVEFTCESEVKITVKNRPKYAQSKFCRFVGTSLLFPSSTQHSNEEYHFVDWSTHSQVNSDTGLYSSKSQQLALMMCLSGSGSHPGVVMDHQNGYGVIFTCQF